MNEEMDFYDPLPPTDSFALQEMIECDMRAQVYDGQDLDCPVHMNELDFSDDPLRCSSTDRLGHIHNHHHPHLDVSALDVKLDSDLNLVCDTNLTWVSSSVCRLSSPSPLLGRTSSGGGNLDFDPGSLLVNPQTGLPITLVSAQLRATNNGDDTGSRWRRPPSSSVTSRLDPTEDSDEETGDEPYVLVNPAMTASPVPPARKRSTTTTTILISDSTDDDDDDDDDPSESEEDDDDEEEPVPRYYNGKAKINTLNGSGSRSGGKSVGSGNHSDTQQRERAYPKPAYSYSCLIAMALKNSKAGSLPVSEIYSFMTENFPYFKTAPNGWKNSVRHNLSLNKCFEKIEKPVSGTNQRKGCLWAMNPNKVEKMEEEVVKWGKKDPNAIKQSMARPEYFELLEKGCLKPKNEMADNRVVLPPQPPPKKEAPPPEVKATKADNLKVVAKIKTEPTRQDTVVLESNLYMDNSLLDLNVQGHLWEELDDKMDFDIPLSNDGLPSIQSCFASDVNDKNLVLGGNSNADKLSNSETMFFSKHIRALPAPAMK